MFLKKIHIFCHLLKIYNRRLLLYNTMDQREHRSLPFLGICSVFFVCFYCCWSIWFVIALYEVTAIFVSFGRQCPRIPLLGSSIFTFHFVFRASRKSRNLVQLPCSTGTDALQTQSVGTCGLFNYLGQICHMYWRIQKNVHKDTAYPIYNGENYWIGL